MGMKNRIWGVLALAAVVSVFGICSKAQAGLIPTNVTITPDGSNFRWTYAVVVTTDVHVQSGDFFTIYDFGGLTSLASVATPAGWAVTSAMVGPTPAGTSPSDSATIPNLTFTYTGPTITGQVGLGNFWAISTFGNSTTSDFTSITQTNSSGRSEANITTTNVPVPGISNTPEPATLAMFGLGLPVFGIGGWLRRRMRKQSQVA
jgi:hypothetical protein